MHPTHSPNAHSRRQVPASSPPDKPRKPEVVPLPYSGGPLDKAGRPGSDRSHGQQESAAVMLLEQNLNEFKAENQLLGQLLQTVQADRRALEERLQVAVTQLEQERDKAEGARQETLSLQSDLQQLKRRLLDKEAKLERACSLQQELEDLVVTLHDTCNQQASALAAAVFLEGRQPASQGEAAPPPGKGHQPSHPALLPDRQRSLHAQQLEQERHERVRELQRQHAAELERLEQESRAEVARVERGHRQGIVAMRRDMQQLIAQIKEAAEAEVRQCMDTLERQAGQQLRILEQLDRRVSLLGAQSERLKSSLSRRDQAQQGEGRAGAAAPALERRYMGAIEEAEREVTNLRCQVEGLVSEKRQLEAHLSGLQLLEGSQRLRAEDALSRTQRSREELLKYIEQVHTLLGANAELQRDKVMQVEQVAAAEEAIKELRAEVGSLRLQLVEARMQSSDLLLSTARTRRKPPVSTPGYPETPPPASDADAGSQAQAILKDSFLESQYLEQRTRALLSCARNEQLAAQRALLLQVRRMQALEAMRLADVQEIYRMGKLVDGAGAAKAATVGV